MSHSCNIKTLGNVLCSSLDLSEASVCSRCEVTMCRAHDSRVNGSTGHKDGRTTSGSMCIYCASYRLVRKYSTTILYNAMTGFENHDGAFAVESLESLAQEATAAVTKLRACDKQAEQAAVEYLAYVAVKSLTWNRMTKFIAFAVGQLQAIVWTKVLAVHLALKTKA